MVFNKQVSENRYQEIISKYREVLNGWEAKQTNGDKLYEEAGCSWTKVDMNKFKTISWEDSWKDMPKEAIAYLKSLPEFDAAIFTEITGLKVEPKETIKIGEFEYDKTEVETLLQGIMPIKGIK